MHFMFFSAQYLPTVGGVERYTANLGKELVNNDHRVTVVTSAMPGLPAEETGEDGIHIIRLPVMPFMGGRFPVLKVSAEKRAFIKAFKADRPDFCVIQTRFYTSSLMAARICKKYGVSALVIEHGTAYLMRGGITGVLGRIYEHVTCRYVHWLCHEFYGVSAACCSWLRNFGVDSDKVLYNSVEPAVLEQLAKQGAESLAAKVNLDGEGLKVVFAARFIPEKGVEQLIRAFGRVKEKYPDSVLVMAGDGPLWQKANEQKGEGVILPGRLAYEESLALIKAGDVFILPTFSEGFATTVLEAAALRTVVLTTPTGGSPQLIIDEDHGILFPTMEEDDIYEALDRALADTEWRRVAAENAYRNLASNFTWQETGRRLIAVAETALEEKQSI